jgi:UDP-2,3-diacylglucosamine pyrophosphatase LpxH
MHLSSSENYIVIGDVHGCIDELKQLLRQNGFIIDPRGVILSSSTPKSIILLGDFIDKGSHEKIAETIEFVYQNFYHLNRKKQQFYLLRGNHEEMVYRYLSSDPTLEITPKRLEEKDKYYNTVELLEQDGDLKSKFLELYADCFIWLKYSYGDDFSAILTHAPCAEQYLGERDTLSHKKMVKSTSRSKNPNIKLDDLIPFVHQEARDNTHYHIFGHLSQPNIRRYKNRICIDTSAIYGDALSCAIIKEDTLRFDAVLFQNRQKSASQVYNLLFDF